ncbi:hypothetical protein KP79_PYT12612 [Mizuhopecten yessoensis]|uniref:Uncharacterized protein n=1 Tax=Mizuhopecten yessoensis TaxID=6573 RepID=A0A210Q4Y7_MIZYE|nr:hypothetical protein KP79_PYT12612 [Mizuhopecten yessoensis]
MYFIVQWVFILILFARICGHISQASVIKATTETSLKSWTEASISGACQLAGGTQSSGISLGSLTFNVTDSQLPTSEVWIGATVSYSGWIELQSCNLGKEIDTNYRYDISKSTDPAETCLDKCGNTSFYLTSEWCYCPAGVTYSEISGCNVKFCQGDRLCGEDAQVFSTFTYYCMCKYDPVSVSSDNLIGECKKVVHDDENTVQIMTADCADENPVLCVDLNNGNQYIPGGISKSWAVAASVCNGEGAIIVGTEGASVPFNGNYFYWIGVFRIAHVTWETTHTGIPNYCLSVVINSNGTANRNIRTCSTQLPSLCETTPVVTVTQTVSQEQTTSVVTTSGSMQGTTMDSSSPGQNTTAAMSQVATDRTGLIVGLVLAVLAGLAIAALTQYIITKRRREKKEREERKRLGSLQRLPHSLRKAGEENKLSFMESGNNAHIYNDLNELQHSKSANADMYDHVQTGRASMNLYSELKGDGHHTNATVTTTYDTMASINAEREAQERAQAPIPPSDDDMYNSLGKV